MYSKKEAEKLVKDNIGSLEKLCKEAICTADLNLMLAMGFPEGASQRICEIIKAEAKNLKILNLHEHYERSIKEGRSNIINTIVRRKHKVYFATRANLHPIIALEHFETHSADICSILFKRSITKISEMKKTRREAILGKEIKRLARPTIWLESGEGRPHCGDGCSGDFAGRTSTAFGCDVL